MPELTDKRGLQKIHAVSPRQNLSIEIFSLAAKPFVGYALALLEPLRLEVSKKRSPQFAHG